MNEKVAKRAISGPSQPQVAGGGDPPQDSSMDARLAKLEALVTTLATKADVEKGFHDLVKWVVGTALVGIGMALTIMTFVLNNAVPKAPAAISAPQAAPAPAVPAPIIIQMPPQTQVVAPAKAPPPPAKP
ncbi:TPA: hypothetical protein ACXNQV_002160 [Stenotrophomonas maltophilia]